jgi:hypothetical protein
LHPEHTLAPSGKGSGRRAMGMLQVEQLVSFAPSSGWRSLLAFFRKMPP